MKKYAVIKDSVRNTPLVVAVRDGEIVSVHGMNEYGKSVAQHILKSGSLENKSLPDGVEITEFKSVSGNAAALFDTYINKSIIEMPNINSIIEPAIKATFDKKFIAKSFKERKVFSSNNEKKVQSGRQIRKFSDPSDKVNVVAFKASSFKSRLKKSSVITPLSAYGMGFDSSSNLIIQKKSKNITDHSINKINSFVGEGAMRRFARKALSSTLDGTRLTRRSNSLSKKLDEVSEKSLSSQHRYLFSIEARLKRMS
jgi:hypothetical protein